ncbi:MAG: hypothetical protein QOE26_1821 [Verrucomicrobiota bacterium]|jgi:hypothetical protein
MRFQRSLLLLSAATVAATLTLSAAAEDSKTPAFQFRQVNYFHRWSKDNQNEFTPDKQGDLDHWSDMITLNAYPGVDDGEKMAGTANAVLGNYRSHQGKILKTRSEPATNDRPAEHFISVMFARPAFVEIAFARFKLVEKKGHSFVYSHRFYGEKANEQANAWLKANGDDVEKALMAWEGKVERGK